MAEGKTMVQALNRAHRELLQARDRVVVMGEDVGVNGGVFRVTDDLLEEFGESRVMDTPLAEAGILGSALGMAVEGMRPIAEIQFSGFMHPGMDQLVSHIARYRNRTRGKFECPLTVRAPYTGGIQAPEHHSESLEAIYCHVPGIKVVTCSTPVTARRVLHRAVDSDDPYLVLEPKRIYRSQRQPLDDEVEPLDEPSSRRVSRGSDVTVVTWGAMTQDVTGALGSNSVEADADHLDLLSLYPLDEQALVESVKRTGRLLVVQEAPRFAGLASEVITRVVEEAFLHLEAPPERVTGYDTVMPYAKLEDQYIPDESRILDGLREVLSF